MLSVLLWALAGCTSVPITSMYKLMTLNPAELDPVSVRVAAITPRELELKDGDVFIWIREPGMSRENQHRFPLSVQQDATRDIRELPPARPQADEHLFILSLSELDARRLGEFQRQIFGETGAGALEKEDYRVGVTIAGGRKHSSIALSRAPIDLYLKTDADRKYFHMIRSLDLANTDLSPYPNLSEWPECNH